MTNRVLELKLKCCYLRVPQRRGKASQTYLNTLAKRAAMQAAGGEFMSDGGGDGAVVNSSNVSQTPSQQPSQQPSSSSASPHGFVAVNGERSSPNPYLSHDLSIMDGKVNGASQTQVQAQAQSNQQQQTQNQQQAQSNQQQQQTQSGQQQQQQSNQQQQQQSQQSQQSQQQLPQSQPTQQQPAQSQPQQQTRQDSISLASLSHYSGYPTVSPTNNTNGNSTSPSNYINPRSSISSIGSLVGTNQPQSAKIETNPSIVVNSQVSPGSRKSAQQTQSHTSHEDPMETDQNDNNNKNQQTHSEPNEHTPTNSNDFAIPDHNPFLGSYHTGNSLRRHSLSQSSHLSSFSPLLDHSPGALLGLTNAPSPWFQSSDNHSFSGAMQGNGNNGVTNGGNNNNNNNNGNNNNNNNSNNNNNTNNNNNNNIPQPINQQTQPQQHHTGSDSHSISSQNGNSPSGGIYRTTNQLSPIEQAALHNSANSRAVFDHSHTGGSGGSGGGGGGGGGRPGSGASHSPQNLLMDTGSTGSGSSRHERRYPILDTIEHLLDPLPMSLAEDLLEEYFSHSTHVLAYLVRRSSVLSPIRPRRTSYSLILAMLLVAAHHSDNPLITGTPTSRSTIISKLTTLTIDHLSPVTELTAPGTLDDVITYIQIATIVSASEYKGTSLRWWANAWDLAKELKLNREVQGISPETREEQRRTWWLLYMVDRHLGLCYNRPLAILDSECMDVYRPGDEDIWDSDIEITSPEMDPSRIRGICHIVTGQGIYGYFLPLMSILGTLVEIHHLEQNPLLQLSDACRQMRSTVRGFLDQYTASVNNWNPIPCQHAYQNAWRDYAFQLIHVFHILYSVSWDPIELLEFSESLMLNPEFGKVTNHAIAAVKSIRRILTIDPDLMLMPFFFGIYLLQGSFVFLAIVDRVESEASQEVVAACETIVHAHEVCIVTLNTEYQRNFRRIMRTTMGLLQSDQSQTSIGSIPKEEARRKQQDVLGLYRWKRGGRGLAVQ